jgi:predicted MFS family arabinose efflux permease
VARPEAMHRVLGGVYGSTLLSMMAYALVTVSLPFRFQALGFSVFQYGVVLAVYAFGMLATESLWGALAFRLGRRRLIALLGAVVTALLVAIGFSTSVLAFALTLGLLGMFLVFPVPLLRWLALSARGPGTAGRGTGRYGLFFGTGLVVGAAVSPLVYEAVGFLPLALVAAAVFASSVAWLAFVPWNAVRLPARDSSRRHELRSVLTPAFATAALLVVLYFVAYSLPISFLQYYSTDLFGGTPTDAGYLIAMARGTAVLAGFVLGPLVDRWGPPRTAPAGFVLVIAGTLATFVSTSFPELVASTVVFAVGAGWLSANLLPLALARVPASAQGTAVGVFGSFEDLGLLIGPVLIGAVYALDGARAIFPVVALVALTGCAVALAFGRKGAPDSAPIGLPRSDRG